MDVERRHEVAVARTGRTRRHRHAGQPRQRHDRPRVARDLLELGVAADGRHRPQVDGIPARGEQDGDRVVVAGVAVEQDGLGRGIGAGA